MTIAHVLRTGFALLFCLIHCASASAEIVAAGYANGVVEVTFTAEQKYADPFNDVTLDLIVTDPHGGTKRLPAYWAGGNEWRGRYSSPIVGTHQVRTECNQPSDKGLQGVAREIAIAPYAGDNPLYIHGPLRAAADRRTLEHADGTPFFWLADTWWMGLSGRLQRDEVRTLADDRRAKGFNVVQIVMGPPPDSHPFDPRSANGGGFAWEADYAAMRPEYYDEADQKINDLLERGFVPCMVGMWGYHIEFMGVERAKQHWRYLIARYGAMPVVWCAAGEANLPWYLAPGFPFDDREQVTEWTEVLRYIRETDPYHRLLTVHPTGFGWSARYATDDVNLLDFDLLQTPHGQRDAVDTTVGKSAGVVCRGADDAGDRRRGGVRNAGRLAADALDAANVLALHDQRRGGPHVRRQRHLAVQSAGRSARPVAAASRGRHWLRHDPVERSNAAARIDAGGARQEVVRAVRVVEVPASARFGWLRELASGRTSAVGPMDLVPRGQAASGCAAG